MRWLGHSVGYLQDWTYWAERDGWRTALVNAILDMGSLPYRHTRFLVVARSLSEPLPDLRPKIMLEIRPFEPADVELVRHIHRPSEARICTQRLAHGHHGVVAQHQGRIVGYGWGCTDMSLERMPVTLRPGDVLCTDAYTAPAYRGQGIQTALMLARMRLFGDLGYKRMLACIIENNYPSLAVWRKVDSQVVQKGDFKRIGPWRRVRYVEVAP